MPLVYVLTTDKKRDTYDKILSKLLEIQENINPTDVMLDFEMAAIKSVQQHFPLTEVHGCFFHFTQNVWRHVQSSGLQAVYASDEDFALQIRLLMALAFVPSEKVLEAYEELAATDFFSEDSDSEYANQVQALLSYFQTTYVYKITRTGVRKEPLFVIPSWNVFESTLLGNY